MQLDARSANQSLYASLHDHFLIMARRRQAPPVAEVISSSPSGCDRGPTGTSPARGEIMVLNLRKGFLPTRAIFNSPGAPLSLRRAWRVPTYDAPRGLKVCCHSPFGRWYLHEFLAPLSPFVKASLARLHKRGEGPGGLTNRWQNG